MFICKYVSRTKKVSSVIPLFLPVQYIERFINEYFRDNLEGQMFVNLFNTYDNQYH